MCTKFFKCYLYYLQKLYFLRIFDDFFQNQINDFVLSKRYLVELENVFCHL